MVRFSFRDRVADTFRLSANWQSIEPCRGQAVGNTMRSNSRPVVLQGAVLWKGFRPRRNARALIRFQPGYFVLTQLRLGPPA
jgi:hypothetical protein